MGRFKQSFCLPCFLENSEPKSVRTAIETAAKIGYPAVELWDADEKTLDLVCGTAQDNGMAVASICGHGSLTDGLNKRENHERIRRELLTKIDTAQKRKIPNLICFSGNRYGVDDKTSIGIVAEGFKLVSKQAESAGVMLNLELLNTKVDHPGYQCDHTSWGVEVVRQTGSPNVKLLYDIYHMQIMEGDLCRTISENIGCIGHFHTAGNPGRHDMDETQEIYYPEIARTINRTGFDRYVGHEFMPKGDKLAALKQAFDLFNV